MLAVEYGVCPNVVPKTLAAVFSMCSLHVIPSIEGDTQIFNTIYKRDVPSILNPLEQPLLLLIQARHGPRTKNTVLLLHKEDHTENKSRDS
jgi:hypothetical protein